MKDTGWVETRKHRSRSWERQLGFIYLSVFPPWPPDLDPTRRWRLCVRMCFGGELRFSRFFYRRRPSDARRRGGEIAAAILAEVAR